MEDINNIKNKIYKYLNGKEIDINKIIYKYIPNLIDTKENKNFIIDYKHCLDKDATITINLLNHYYILKNLNIDVNSMINIYSYHWRELINLENVKGNHITTAYEFFKCKKIEYKTILIDNKSSKSKSVKLEKDAILLDINEIAKLKLEKKYEFIFFHLFKDKNTPNYLEIDDWFSTMIKFIDNNLIKGGHLLIEINEFTDNVINLFENFIKLNKFRDYKCINIEYPNPISIISSPRFVYFEGFNEKSIESTNFKYKLDGIMRHEFRKYIIIHDQLIKNKNKKDIKKFIINGIIQFCITMDLSVNYLFINKYNYKTWISILKEYAKHEINILEIGVYKGVSSVWFLDNLMKNKNSRLYLCDTWTGSVEYNNDFNKVFEIFSKNIEKAPHNDQIIINKKRSDEALMQYIKENINFDIIFIDASHDSRDVMLDAMLSWKVLKLNGILIFDDYLWNKMPNDYECPKLAIDNFVKMYRDNIKILKVGYQVIIKKIKNY